MQVSVVITVLNEAHSLSLLCDALSKQTLMAEEVIIVDGGSSDASFSVLQNCKKRYPKLNLRIIRQPGNRSVGRNAGIRTAKNDWIAITDSGCEPSPHWLAELCATQTRTQALVVAGYYQGKATSPLSEAIIPYVLVMPDQIDPDHFLPATRSMLLAKSVWRKLGGFNEQLHHNEDYAFARQLQTLHYTIAFAQTAIVYWHSRTTLKSFAYMIYRFALGDAESHCWRTKVWLIFGRYIITLGGLSYLAVTGNTISASILGCGILLCYGCWAIIKNYRFVKQGWYWLPILQLTSDLMVIIGTSIGILKAKT